MRNDRECLSNIRDLFIEEEELVLSLPSVESQVCHVYGAVTVAVKAAGSSLCVSRMLSMQKVQVEYH